VDFRGGSEPPVKKQRLEAQQQRANVVPVPSGCCHGTKRLVLFLDCDARRLHNQCDWSDEIQELLHERLDLTERMVQLVVRDDVGVHKLIRQCEENAKKLESHGVPVPERHFEPIDTQGLSTWSKKSRR